MRSQPHPMLMQENMAGTEHTELLPAQVALVAAVSRDLLHEAALLAQGGVLFHLHAVLLAHGERPALHGAMLLDDTATAALALRSSGLPRARAWRLWAGDGRKAEADDADHVLLAVVGAAV